ncbi:MAG: (2Fe-2S) ferredoxin domain-containing protein [Cyanobacteria bacterium SZAS LIN-2]|nr:(2Fe-2S) ferredoxin domain-containing protein [Cyanobacteria bacterium SZAS LIN-3]MBS1997541.1 (2Fe-2S) ferredoxin domain-containing protein [Cyanobacteria bacterium SZAS LIN-2]
MEVFEKHVFVCVSGKTCPNEGAVEVCDELRKQISSRGLKGKIRINKAGCFDQCGNGPLIVVYPESTWYAHVKPEDVNQIVEEHLIGNKPVERLFYDGRGRIRD